MMAGIVFSTLKVPLPLSRRVSRMRPSHNHTLNITASSGQATNVSVSFAHHPGMSTHTGNADIGFGAYMSMVVGIACGAIAAYDPALISAFRATINGMSFIKAMVEDDALYSCDHRGCSHVAPTKKALNYHKNGHGSKEGMCWVTRKRLSLTVASQHRPAMAVVTHSPRRRCSRSTRNKIRASLMYLVRGAYVMLLGCRD